MVNINNMSFAFNRGEPVLKNLSMELRKNRTYGLFGLNGAGKTTLLNLLSGMLFPAGGECMIMGKPVKDRNPKNLSELFIVPEQFDLPSVTPKTFTDLHAPFYPRFNWEQMGSLMHQFTVDSKNNLTEQSYGQRKKFLIAFAISTNTGILLMDEPTNGLDIPSKSQFRKVMVTTNREDRCTLISTHQVRDLEQLIDRVTILHQGKIIFDQSVESISDKLVIARISEGEPSEKIYGEETVGGQTILRSRKPSDNESQPGLEFLFNASIQETELLNQAFHQGEEK